MRFTKITAAGNDFILIYNINKKSKELKKLAINLCNRHYGIGADGLLVVNQKKGEFNLKYYNPDGTPAFCGNGTRSCGLWLYKNVVRKNKFFINTSAGRLLIKILKNKVYAQMPAPDFIKNISFNNSKYPKATYIRVGTNHLVIEINDIDKINIEEDGKRLRYHNFFKPEGTNVNFVKVLCIKNGVLEAKIRTYEKGVENETYSCSSGITSSFYSLRERYNIKRAIFYTKNNERFYVSFDSSSVFLSGPLKIVFNGEIL